MIVSRSPATDWTVRASSHRDGEPSVEARVSRDAARRLQLALLDDGYAYVSAMREVRCA